VNTIATTVIRHAKERISKCSLRHLHDRPEMTFYKCKPGFRFDATDFTLLAIDAPPLSTADAGRPLLLLDSTWRWLPQLLQCVHGEAVPRSIPGNIATSYPRTSQVYEDPTGGLASVEALYVARKILGDDDESLLDGYHWKSGFLATVRATLS